MNNSTRHYRGLWLILASAFVFFTVLSAIDDSLVLFGYEFKSSKIWPTLTQRKADELDLRGSGRSNAQGNVGTVRNSGPAMPVEVDTVPKTILFFGDSMLDGLYPRLAAYANENGHTLYVVIWYSSTSEVWGRSKKLARYIRDLKPDFIFVSLGANELFVKNIAEKRDKYVKKILTDIGDIPYVWIGPPNWKEDTGINKLVADNAGPHNFFLTKGMQFPRMKDGAHPTHDAAIGWMDSIVRWMPGHSLHPIKMNVPAQKKARAKKVFVHQPSEKD